MEDIVHRARRTLVGEILTEVHMRHYMKFPLGEIVVTRGVVEKIDSDILFAKFVVESLKRHANGDWGDLSAADRRENEFSLDKELRLLSSYKRGDWKIWIITESNRSFTTILFPEEY